MLKWADAVVSKLEEEEDAGESSGHRSRMGYANAVTGWRVALQDASELLRKADERKAKHPWTAATTTAMHRGRALSKDPSKKLLKAWSEV